MILLIILLMQKSFLLVSRISILLNSKIANPKRTFYILEIVLYLFFYLVFFVFLPFVTFMAAPERT